MYIWKMTIIVSFLLSVLRNCLVNLTQAAVQVCEQHLHGLCHMQASRPASVTAAICEELCGWSHLQPSSKLWLRNPFSEMTNQQLPLKS